MTDIAARHWVSEKEALQLIAALITQGTSNELYAIAAAVLGWFSLRGGEGSIVGVVLGVVLLQELQNLVNLLGIPSSLDFAVMGGVTLVGVVLDEQGARFRRLIHLGDIRRAEKGRHNST